MRTSLGYTAGATIVSIGVMLQPLACGLAFYSMMSSLPSMTRVEKRILPKALTKLNKHQIPTCWYVHLSNHFLLRYPCTAAMPMVVRKYSEAHCSMVSTTGSSSWLSALPPHMLSSALVTSKRTPKTIASRALS